MSLLTGARDILGSFLNNEKKHCASSSIFRVVDVVVMCVNHPKCGSKPFENICFSWHKYSNEILASLCLTEMILNSSYLATTVLKCNVTYASFKSRQPKALGTLNSLNFSTRNETVLTVHYLHFHCGQMSHEGYGTHANGVAVPATEVIMVLSLFIVLTYLFQLLPHLFTGAMHILPSQQC